MYDLCNVNKLYSVQCCVIQFPLLFKMRKLFWPCQVLSLYLNLNCISLFCSVMCVFSVTYEGLFNNCISNVG